MKRRDNISAVAEMRKMLGDTKKLMLENFIMPEEDSFERDNAAEEVLRDEQPLENDMKESDISNIEKELIQIRKIALSVINRLADKPTSESYDTMKRIWTLVDRAIESKRNGEGE